MRGLVSWRAQDWAQLCETSQLKSRCSEKPENPVGTYQACRWPRCCSQMLLNSSCCSCWPCCKKRYRWFCFWSGAGAASWFKKDTAVRHIKTPGKLAENNNQQVCIIWLHGTFMCFPLVKQDKRDNARTSALGSKRAGSRLRMTAGFPSHIGHLIKASSELSIHLKRRVGDG